MLFLQNVKRFFTKAEFDFENPDIDLDTFHPQCRTFLLPMGIFFHNKSSLFRFVWPFLCVCLTFCAVGMELLFVLHGLEVKDYSFATECFCYFVLLGIIPVVYGAHLVNKSVIVKLMESMNRDFLYICKLTTKHRTHFMEGQLLIWKLCFAWIYFLIFIAIMYTGMTIVPLFYQSLFATLDEHMVRPLIFPMWLPKDDPYRTPNYEVFLFLQLSFLILYVQCFGAYVYIQFHVLIHNKILLDLVIMDFDTIFDGLDEAVANLPRQHERRVAAQMVLNRRFKRIVTWHDSVFTSIESLSLVHGPPLMYQVGFSSVALCLMLYQVADKLDKGVIDILFIVLFFAACVQLLIPCYLGTMLRNRAFDVGDACWTCGWHETSLGRMARVDILILILRSQKPLSIQFTGLPNLSLETFSSIMSTAYSYFNMLRQYN